MKKILSSILVAGALILGAYSPAHADPVVTYSQGTIVKVIEPIDKCARIYSWDNMSGSGFFIEGGYVVTNDHVILYYGSDKLTVQDGNKNVYTAEVVARDAHRDLALLKLKEPVKDADPIEGHKYFDIYEGSLSTGGKYEAFTNTFNDQWFMHKTGELRELNKWEIIADTNGADSMEVLSENTRNIYSFTSEPGNSGSAIIDAYTGKVVGVVAATTPGTHLAVGVTLEDLRYFIEKNKPQ